MHTIHMVIRELLDAGRIEGTADEYAEPGYEKTTVDLPILFADWNSERIIEIVHIRSGAVLFGSDEYGREREVSSWVGWGERFREQRMYLGRDETMPRVSELAERAGYTIEWSDEWMTCECGKAFRTSEDSYEWAMHGFVSDHGTVMCGDCVVGDPTEYLEQLEGDHGRAVTVHGVDLEWAGYRNVDPDGRFESGLYGGQCDSPERIADTLRDAGVDRFIFRVDSVGQFDCRFSCFVHKSQKKRARKALFRKGSIRLDRTQGPDPAERMKAALQDASEKMSRLQGDGIRYAKCRQDGTADVRLVSPEEFIDGIRD